MATTYPSEKTKQMVQVSYSYKNREFYQLEDSIMNQIAESGKTDAFCPAGTYSRRFNHGER